MFKQSSQRIQICNPHTRRRQKIGKICIINQWSRILPDPDANTQSPRNSENNSLFKNLSSKIFLTILLLNLLPKFVSQKFVSPKLLVIEKWTPPDMIESSLPKIRALIMRFSQKNSWSPELTLQSAFIYLFPFYKSCTLSE